MNRATAGQVTVAEPVAVDAAASVPARLAPQPLEWSGVLAQNGYVFGADVSGEGERVVLADLHGNVVGRVVMDNGGTGEAPDEVVSRVSGAMKALLKEHSIKPREVLRAAVGFGGPVDALLGQVRTHHDAPGWEGFPLADRVGSALDVPTFLDNDARLAALGEVWFGAGRSTSECDMVYVHWSTGVGGGIVTGGRLLRGSSTLAGEVGHTVVTTAPDALPCRCGGRGHLEAYVRGTALLARARAVLSSDTQPTDTAAIFALASSEPAVASMLDEAVALLGVTIANLITQINPNMVVIGGGVARHAGDLIPRISELALGSAMPVSAKGVTIVPADLGDEATVMGAVALALDSLR